LSALSPVSTVQQALGDLPPLVTGEDGSSKNYVSDPLHSYQSFMRSYITVQDYIDVLQKEITQR
jgi:Cu/Zn superoxide dismutase